MFSCYDIHFNMSCLNFKCQQWMPLENHCKKITHIWCDLFIICCCFHHKETDFLGIGSPKVSTLDTWNCDRTRKYEAHNDWKHFYCIMLSVSSKSSFYLLNWRRRDLLSDCISQYTHSDQCLHDWTWWTSFVLCSKRDATTLKFWLAEHCLTFKEIWINWDNNRKRTKRHYQ